MPAGPDDRDQPRPLLAAGRVEQLLEQPELVVATDERRLEGVGAICDRRVRETTRSARQAGTGLALPLSDLLAGCLERDRLRRGPLSGLADEHGAGRRGRLEPSRGVDEVAGDHALVDGARA